MDKTALPSLATITLDDIASGLDENRFTSVDLVRAYIARIHEVNQHVNAVLEINPDAIDIAQKLDSERRRQGRRGYVSLSFTMLSILTHLLQTLTWRPYPS